MDPVGPFYRVEVETAEDVYRLLVRAADLAELGLRLNPGGQVGFWRFAGLTLDDQTPVIFFIPLSQIQVVICKYYRPEPPTLPS